MTPPRQSLIADTANWPTQPLTETDIQSASHHLAVAAERFLAHHRLPRRYLDLFPRLLIPMAAHLRNLSEDRRTPLLIGVSGTQGSGKTTLTSALQLIFHYVFGTPCCILSIDDFYWPKVQRQALAKDIHPLLATRGVPGTHDIALLERTLELMFKAGKETETPIPLFDKGIDDRRPEEQWARFIGRPGIVILEGWCIGARAEPPEALEHPINQLERQEDPQGVWRSWVNQQLAERYEPLYDRLDQLIFLQAPSWDVVLEWRRLQEQKLIRAQGENYRGGLNDDKKLLRFINHYERITRHMLNTLPSKANIVLALDDTQQISRVSLQQV